ncbi:MAG: bifunctional diguanylate cyclase/phosphodiesterase [Actinomycetota bacterium]
MIRNDAVDPGSPPAAPDAVEDLRLTRSQYLLLGLMLLLVGVIGLLMTRASRDVADRSLALAYELQDVLGDRSSLERQIVKLDEDVEAWRAGEADAASVELSAALVERQLRTALDEAAVDPRLAEQVEVIRASLDGIREIASIGRPPRSSPTDEALQALVDDAMSASRQILSDREIRNVELVLDLEDDVDAAQKVVVVAAALTLVLIVLLVVLMWWIHRTNYRNASEHLTQEQQRYLGARADKDRAEALALIQTEILELVATDRPAREVFDRIKHRTAEHLPGIELQFCVGADPSNPLRAGAAPMVARESNMVLGELEWTCENGVAPPADFELILAFAAGLGALAVDRHEAAEAMVFQATHDSLTGLPNRSLLTTTVEQALARSKTKNTQVALLFLDLDRFKVINDTFGHDAGDQILMHFSRCLMSSVRAADTVARLAGDEFVVLMEDAGELEQVEQTARRIQAALEAPVDVDGVPIQLAACIGIAHGDGDMTVDELLRNADLAMYRAKKNGRDRFEFFDEDLRDWTERRTDMELALRAAIDHGELEAHFQPLFDTESLRIVAFESLVRWNRPGVGMVSPGEFIELAEEVGFVDRIDRFMLRAAIEAVTELRAITPTVVVGVNVSARDLSHPDFVEDVEALLRSTGTQPSALVLEITETTMVEDAELIAEGLERLRAIGVQIAIDDFGTGYSSLRYLRDLPADHLKVDQAFVSGSYDSELADPQIVASVIDLGHAVGLEVIAEGVETTAQLEALKILGADVVQGFLLSRPLNLENAKSLLQTGLDPSDLRASV